MGRLIKVHEFKDGKVIGEDRIAYANGEFISFDDFDTEIQSRNAQITQLKHDLEKTYNQLMKTEKETQQKIAELEKTRGDWADNAVVWREKCEKAEKKIKELESELETKENLQKINLNDIIKVKLTPYGAEIYYKQFDEINKQYGKTVIEPQMPPIDKDGYTKFQLHTFMELYGKYMHVGVRNVIEPIDIVLRD